MAEQNNPSNPTPIPPDEDNFIEDPNSPEAIASAAPTPSKPASLPTTEATANQGSGDDRMNERLERLGGEPAPVITPEEFARLQKSGQVNIDAQGRVRTARRTGAEAGVSLRKRRAWYADSGENPVL